MARTARLTAATLMATAIALTGATAADAAARPVPARAATAVDGTQMKRPGWVHLTRLKHLAAGAIDAKKAALTVADRQVAAAGLDDATTAALRTNIAADQATLATLRVQVAAATTTAAVQVLTTTARGYRAENYTHARFLVVTADRHLARAADQAVTIATLTAAADARAAQGHTVTAARTALAAATAAHARGTTAATQSKTHALTIRATSNPWLLRGRFPSRLAVTTAARHLAAVDAHLADARTALGGTGTVRRWYTPAVLSR